jgi:hypothetical protein
VEFDRDDGIVTVHGKAPLAVNVGFEQNHFLAYFC